MRDILYILVFGATIVVVISVCAWISNAVIASDLPDWLKYMILK